MNLAGIGMRNVSRNKFAHDPHRARRRRSRSRVHHAPHRALGVERRRRVRRQGPPRHAPQGLVHHAAAEALHRRQSRQCPASSRPRGRTGSAPRTRSDPNEFFATLAVDPETSSRSTTRSRSRRTTRPRWLAGSSAAPSSATSSRRSSGLKVGDKFTLHGTIYPGDWEFNIDGIYTATAQIARSLAVPLPLGRT